MKKITSKLHLFAFAIVMSLFLVACGGGHEGHDHAGHDHSGHSHQHEQQSAMEIVEETDTTALAWTAPYVCPMHCKGSGSDKEGTCPACGMAYEPNTKK